MRTYFQDLYKGQRGYGNLYRYLCVIAGGCESIGGWEYKEQEAGRERIHEDHRENVGICRILSEFMSVIPRLAGV